MHRYTFTCILKHVHIYDHIHTLRKSKEQLLAAWATANVSMPRHLGIRPAAMAIEVDLPYILAINRVWESSPNGSWVLQYGIGFTTFIYEFITHWSQTHKTGRSKYTHSDPHTMCYSVTLLTVLRTTTIKIREGTLIKSNAIVEKSPYITHFMAM